MPSAPNVRIVGSETEYGIATPTQPELSPIITSTHAVVGYAVHHQHATRWDFEGEAPLRDQRGFDLRRYHQVPVVDPHALGVANTMLVHGGRLYVDHAHPEYAAPEATNALSAARYDAAGDLVLLEAVRLAEEHTKRGHSVLAGHEPCPPLRIYKNNVDGKGASYGAHENYSYHRDVDFADLAQALIPFFVTRQVLIGAGRVGLGPAGEQAGFQISQRADYIEQEISLETTLNRGIINTRDESHTTEEFGRLHVILGDANMSHISMLLKYGLTKLVLDAIEAGETFSDLALINPVAEVSAVSRNTNLDHRLRLSNGGERTALDILASIRERLTPSSPEDTEVLRVFDEVHPKLARSAHEAADMLDWCAKLQLLRQFEAKGISLQHPKAKLVDLQYTDVDSSRSLYHALVRNQRMRTLFSHDELQAALRTPPASTRAWLRGTIIQQYNVTAASWEHLTVACGEDSVRIHMPHLTRPNASDAPSGTFDAAWSSADQGGRGADVQRLREQLLRWEAAGLVCLEWSKGTAHSAGDEVYGF